MDENKSSQRRRLVIFIGLLLIFVILSVCGGYYFIHRDGLSEDKPANIVVVSETEERESDTKDAFIGSLLRNSPTALQNMFLEDVRNGVNDKVTKSAIYFITHRFFDNGGNIYEIYDYIESHPELAFMKEAEAIYPKIFDQIKKKQVPPTFVDRAIYAYLAYVEVLQKHGYADIAAVGTAANQYAKTAYNTTMIAKEMTPKAGAARSRNAKRDIAKALKFIKDSKGDVVAILKGDITSEDITPRDILVGMNQYGSALRYLEALGVKVNTPKKAKEVFDFTMEYSHRNVPELTLFTSFLNASTLAILNVAEPVDIRKALYPILEFNAKGRLLETSIIHKIIDARFEKEPIDIGDANMDIYGKRNVLRLASKVPEFKAWLMSNGWVEDDFKIK